MEDQLISFKTAKLAKEKGFNYTVSQGFDLRDLEYQGFGLPKGIQLGICTNALDHSVAAPTQSLLQKWLREKHNIHLVVDICCPEPKRINKFACIVYSNLVEEEEEDNKEYLTYEEALEEGLYEALKLIKK